MIQRIQRTRGETRTHLYDYSQQGYPIRVCIWAVPEYDFIENGDARLCKYCQAYLEGKRKIYFAPSPVIFDGFAGDLIKAFQVMQQAQIELEKVLFATMLDSVVAHLKRVDPQTNVQAVIDELEEIHEDIRFQKH